VIIIFHSGPVTGHISDTFWVRDLRGMPYHSPLDAQLTIRDGYVYRTRAHDPLLRRNDHFVSPDGRPTDGAAYRAERMLLPRARLAHLTRPRTLDRMVPHRLEHHRRRHLCRGHGVAITTLATLPPPPT